MSNPNDYACTRDRFLADTKGHSMTIVLDQDLHRHLQFRGEGSCYWFDIITTPGLLVISGDCGDFAFRRLRDMFGFFRQDDRGFTVNRGYWAEKCTTANYEQLTEFDQEMLWAGLVYELRTHGINDRMANFDALRELIEVARGSYGEQQCMVALSEFPGGWPEMCELPTHRAWSFHYEWCLWAIVWGIHQYDEHHAKLKEQAARMGRRVA